MKIWVDYVKLSDRAVVPTKGSEGAAGYDLYAALEYPVSIAPGAVYKIPTDIAVAIPKNHFGAIFARSGMATKKGLSPANSVGVIDEDYRGNVIVALRNYSNDVSIVEPQEKIAQLVFMPYATVKFNSVDKLSETKRGEGGFGSTG